MTFLRFVLWLTLVFVPAENPADLYRRAVTLHQSGNFEGAVREYRQALALDPANFQARSNLGAALVRLGRLEEAIAEYRKALESAPAAAQGPLHLNLSLAYYKSGSFSEAARELEAHPPSPDNLQAIMVLADCHLRLGELPRVIDLLTPLVSSHPDERGISYMLGMALIRNGEVEKGQALIDPILGNRDSAEAHFVLGSVAFMAKDYPNALREFAKARAVNPDLPSLESYYGQTLLFTGDPDAAATAFQKELGVDPNDYDSNLRLGQILSRRRQFEEAKALFERALRLRPESAEAAYGIASSELAQSRPGAARQRLESIVAKWPKYGDAHEALALADEQLGRKEEASRERELAARLDPGSGGLALGTLAPDFTLPVPTGDGRIRLSDFRGKRPVVVILGSYTCPKLRSQANTLNGLYERFHDQAEFLLVYIREAHGKGAWQSTINEREGLDLTDATSLAQKREYAATCIRKLQIRYDAAVDLMEDPTEKAYSGWPSRLYLVDKDGYVVFGSILDELRFDSQKLALAIQTARGH